jgi:hypothetical protein
MFYHHSNRSCRVYCAEYTHFQITSLLRPHWPSIFSFTADINVLQQRYKTKIKLCSEINYFDMYFFLNVCFLYRIFKK